MVTRGRGISCSRCNVKIDRYDDSINCKKCDNSYHTKCVNLSVEDFNKIHEDSSQKWYCDDCLQPNVANVDTVEFPPAEVPITKVDLVNVKNEIVNEVSSAFLNEILSLKSLILSQSEQISDLKKEIRILTKCENTTTTTAGPDITEVPADRNSAAESSKPDEQANLDAPNISSEIKNVTEIAENNFKENRLNTNENSSEWIVATSKRRNNIKQAVPIADKPQVHFTSKRMGNSKKTLRPIIGTLKANNLQVAGGVCLCLRDLNISYYESHASLDYLLLQFDLSITSDDFTRIYTNKHGITSSTKIDYILTNVCRDLLVSEVVDHHIGDHRAIVLTFECPVEDSIDNTTFVTFRCLSEKNLLNLSTMAATVSFDRIYRETDIEHCFKVFYDILKFLLDSSCQIKQKRFQTGTKANWISYEVKQASRDLKNLHWLFRNLKSQESRNSYLSAKKNIEAC
ncbi:hypothetical protein WA026_016767 [Henosepilachna vigintioctopunctata]|uniref:PHD-type domain-containing protein n=1 Tax=Henosepilachna vigintioctopunctata TaxID=420089 RepID=A0AAW1UZE7_9CUCU